MRRSVTRTLAIHAPATEVITWLSHPENLPDLYRAILNSCPAKSTRGAVPVIQRGIEGPIPIEVIVDPRVGTVDYVWDTADGTEVAAVRVIPVDGHSQVVVTFFEPPESCTTCTSLEERSAAVEADLLMLKALVEGSKRRGMEVWH